MHSTDSAEAKEVIGKDWRCREAPQAEEVDTVGEPMKEAGTGAEAS